MVGIDCPGDARREVFEVEAAGSEVSKAIQFATTAVRRGVVSTKIELPLTRGEFPMDPSRPGVGALGCLVAVASQKLKVSRK